MRAHYKALQGFKDILPDEQPYWRLFENTATAVAQVYGYRRDDELLSLFTGYGYQEEGTTTTPFDMNVRNGTSRYHLIMQAIRLTAANNVYVAARANERVHHYEYILRDYRRFIQANGVDPEDITNWHWK